MMENRTRAIGQEEETEVIMTGEIAAETHKKLLEMAERAETSMTNFEFLQACTMEEAVVALCEMDKWIKQKIKGEIGGYNKYFKGDYYREWLREEHKE